ncbi:probable polygalacturonase At3g15720 [Gastrolobium bilobum]|uniref:probable polygalacturonase At3g15720 n=1 Tax=Gastrolobium bilobum TaxID=150636 RepID=UPI002AAFA118|nr:probable polygalacturonase At3g15720 [Gastrolobium bilobum]
MQALIISCVLIFGFVSPCLCLRWNVVGTKNTYDVMAYGAHGDGKSDDSQAFLSAWKNTCEAEGASTLVIPRGKVFMVNSITLIGNCKATSIHIQISQLITISYVNGLTIDGGGLIYGHGSDWWLCRTCPRPRLLGFHSCNNLRVSNLSITNSPGGHISINGCNGATFSHLNIHAPPDSPNTDGIDISASKNVLIEDSAIGTGDDCIAINGGCSYINATRIACGPGHGISIGSLGRNGIHETVEEVYVKNCSINGTTNGARIKTCPGGSGYARKITFEQITLIKAHNPILIDQYYNDVVKVSEVTYRGFEGTSADEQAINLNCSSLGCFNLVLDQINIVSSQPGKKTYASCNNAHGIVGSTTPRVSCLLK